MKITTIDSTKKQIASVKLLRDF